MTSPFTDPSLPVAGTRATIGDFWQWAFSDIISNDTRGALAEYLVGLALGCLDEPRLSWDAVDLRYRGAGIEVKSTARWQSWPQSVPSRPEFGIAPAKAWDAATNVSHEESTRSADVYVFAYLDVYPATTDDVVNPSAWEFFVVRTAVLDELYPGQGRLALSRVRALTGSIGFGGIKIAVDDALESDPRA